MTGAASTRRPPLQSVPTGDPGPDLERAPLACERAAVGAALHGGEPARTVLRRLLPHHLSDKRLSDVLAAVAAVERRGDQADVHLVRAELVRTLGPQRTSDVDQLLLELHAQVPLPASADAYCREVLGAHWRRRVVEAATRLEQAAGSSNDDDLAATVADELHAIAVAYEPYRHALDRLRPAGDPC